MYGNWQLMNYVRFGFIRLLNVKCYIVINFPLYFTFIGVYSVGWLSSGPVGVILSTMSNAFQVASLISKHFEAGLLNNSKPGYNYIKSILKEKGIHCLMHTTSLLISYKN